MSQVVFSLATAADDAAIRRLLSSSPMPGRIRVRFEREPSYFAGFSPASAHPQVLVARDGDQVVGLACREVRTLYVNGKKEEIAYLGQLRIAPAHRGRMLVARGFRKLRELGADSGVRGTITTIVDGNDQAEGVLIRRARGVMPRYRFLSRLITLAIPVAATAATNGHGSTDASTDEVRAFLERYGPSRNFFPANAPEGEVITVERDGVLAGVASLNDQRTAKQTIVDGYDRLLTVARPLYNMFAKLRLPRPGSVLQNACVTHFCVADDDRVVARQLLDRVVQRAAGRGLDHILLGLTTRDPLLEVASPLRGAEYASSLYTVSWQPGDDLHDQLDSRPRTLDLSTL